MIALITSTLIPSSVYSVYDPAERLTQTITTIKKLAGAGFTDIYFLDNSANEIDREALTTAYKQIKIFQTPQYSFQNKGLNEALLILNNSHYLPANTPIFKISGRYYPTANFSKNQYEKHIGKEFAGIGYDFAKKVSGFSTKAYFVKDIETLTGVLEQAIVEMLSYAKGIHGIRSAVQALTDAFIPHPAPRYQLSLEQAFARVLKQKNNYVLLDKMNIEGFEASDAKGKLFAE